jgi:hypothetical protein
VNTATNTTASDSHFGKCIARGSDNTHNMCRRGAIDAERVRRCIARAFVGPNGSGSGNVIEICHEHVFSSQSSSTMLISLFVALCRPLQHVLEVHLHLVQLEGAITHAGNCPIPITLVVLGAYFYRPSCKTRDTPFKNSWRTEGLFYE